MFFSRAKCPYRTSYQTSLSLSARTTNSCYETIASTFVRSLSSSYFSPDKYKSKVSERWCWWTYDLSVYTSRRSSLAGLALFSNNLLKYASRIAICSTLTCTVFEIFPSEILACSNIVAHIAYMCQSHSCQMSHLHLYSRSLFFRSQIRIFHGKWHALLKIVWNEHNPLLDRKHLETLEFFLV